MLKRIYIAGAVLVLLSGCGNAGEKGESSGQTGSNKTSSQADSQIVEIATGEGFATRLQEALITASQGSTIVMPAGTYQFVDGLSLDITGVTLRGAGQDKTFLDFSEQTGAGEGLLVTSADVVLEGFTIRDTVGDGIKSKGADGIIYRDLTVEWSGEPDASNGAYGVYPVESKNVLIERVTVRGASDAGIYVGQSSNIIVRNSLAEYNVAGIEIENSSYADVYGNTTRHNTGGVLVFDLPNLPIMGGHSTRIYDNDIYDNNTRNFAPPGNIVATVPSGTGIIIMANENVHIFGNRFANNRTVQIVIGAYQEKFDDDNYNPLPRNIVVRDNSYAGGGDDPQGLMAMFAKGFGGTLPPIVWDGVTAWDGGEAFDVNLSVSEPETVGFLNLGLGSYPVNPLKIKPNTTRPKATAKPEPEKIILAQDK